MEVFQVKTVQFLQVIVQDADGYPVHGATVHAQVFRNSDNAYLDTTTNTFVTLGGNSNILLAELEETGLYRARFDQTLDNGGVDRYYTVIYTISAPYASLTFDSIHFTDVMLDEVKGQGWEQAAIKPSLMHLANKDSNSTFAPNTDSLEALEEKIGTGGTGGSSESYNTEAL